MKHRLDALYVLIATHEDGSEHIVAHVPGMVQLVCDDSDLLPRMMQLAKSTPYAEDEISVAVFARVRDVRTIRRSSPIEPVPDPGPA
jgi:hypothetical protein